MNILKALGGVVFTKYALLPISQYVQWSKIGYVKNAVNLSKIVFSSNEKRGNKQCLLDTPRRVTVNNKRLISKCKKSEKKYAYIQKPWHY